VDFATTLRILLRRWYVVVPALALTGVGAFLGMQQVTPQYESSGSLVLLGPASGVPVPGEVTQQFNAYLEFGGALATTAEVLSKATLSDASAKKLAAVGATGEYEVGTGSDGGSPIINIVATGSSPRIATLTVEEITKLLTAELQRRQVAAKAPPSQFIRVEVVAPPAQPKELLGSKLRVGSAVVALGVAVTFSVAFLVEGAMDRRARRKAVIEQVAAAARPAAPVVPSGATSAGTIPGSRPLVNPPASPQAGSSPVSAPRPVVNPPASPGSSVARSTPRRW
jgi:hypothetical protein